MPTIFAAAASASDVKGVFDEARFTAYVETPRGSSFTVTCGVSVRSSLTRNWRPSIDGVSTNVSAFDQPIRTCTSEPNGRTTSTERTNPAAPASSGDGSEAAVRPQSGPAEKRICNASPSVGGVCDM